MAQDPEKVNHALGVMSLAQNMRLENFICDFKITAGNKTFNIHRLVLAANSGYFKSLFSSNMKEMQDGHVTMDVVDAVVMQQCIEYMYTSTINLESHNVSEILHAANFLQISRLETSCFKYLKKNLSPENSLFVLNLARLFNHEDVENAAEIVIQNNLKAVVSSEEFQAISKRDLLRFSMLANYEISWNAITTWCTKRQDEFFGLVEKVDFSQYSFLFLLCNVLEHSLVTESENIKSIIVRAIFSDKLKLARNLNVANCFKLKKLATDEYSKCTIDSFMERNFSAIIYKPEFCSLSKRDVHSLLTFSEVETEEIKWEAALKWTNEDPKQREEHFFDLFCCLALDRFSLDFIKGTVRTEQLVQKDAACMGMLVDALCNHRCNGKLKRLSISCNESKFRLFSLSSDEEAEPGKLTKDNISPSNKKEIQSKMVAGTRVVRGPDWGSGRKYGKGKGTVTDWCYAPGWVEVTWDKGYTGLYCMGACEKYELNVATSNKSAAK